MSVPNASNNKYNECPARMSDGRYFTDYRSSAMVEFDLQKKLNAPNSYTYRQFLINNAMDVMKSNQVKATCIPDTETFEYTQQVYSAPPVSCESCHQG
jgi:hypothetical protein